MNSLSSSNSFVMFGGYAKYSSTASSLLNDAWRYNATSNNWCLLQGNITSIYPPAVYGTTGIASATKEPEGVQIHGAAFLPGTELLYVFGGTSQSFYQNELWMLNCLSSQWTFLSLAVQAGIYTNGAQYPGIREGHSFVAIPNTSLFVMVCRFLFRCSYKLDERVWLRTLGSSKIFE